MRLRRGMAGQQGQQQLQADQFDDALAAVDGVPPSIAEQPADLAEPSAFALAPSTVPPEVSRGFLAQLGLDEQSPATLFLDFDPEDLTAAKRDFEVEGGRPRGFTAPR